VCSTCRGEHYKTRENNSGEQQLVESVSEDLQPKESESTTSVFKESASPAILIDEGENSGDQDSQTVSSQSQSSQSSIPEEEISIWLDEMEDQNCKRQKLNEAVSNISSGRYSPVMSTLNTAWDDVSDTQQRYYIRKAKETIASSLSVITPGQEELIWKALQTESLFDADKDNQGKRKRFDPSSSLVDDLIKAYQQADHWQTKRQILSLFADDFSRAELQDMIPGLSLNGALIKLANTQQKPAKASRFLKSLVTAQESATIKWTTLLSTYPDQTLSRMWRSELKHSSLTQERR
ncbi:hypothetical protein QZH41_020033, partial [Actinostola sp. cb2023]